MFVIGATTLITPEIPLVPLVPLDPAEPAGIPKLKIAAELVPVLVTVGRAVEARTDVVPAVIVAEVPLVPAEPAEYQN